VHSQTLLLNLQEVLVGQHLPDAVPGTVVIEQLSGRALVKTVRAGHIYVRWAVHQERTLTNHCISSHSLMPSPVCASGKETTVPKGAVEVWKV
jgi:hypothetical protein